MIGRLLLLTAAALACGGCGSADRKDAAPVAVTQLETELDELAAQIEQLQYPELIERDPAEIQAHQAHVTAAESIYLRIHELNLAGAREGSAENNMLARLHLAKARAQLAWATHEIRRAVERHAEAVSYTLYWDKMVTTEPLGSTQIWDPHPWSAHVVARAIASYFRALRIASHAGVDVSDIQPLTNKQLDRQMRAEVGLPQF